MLAVVPFDLTNLVHSDTLGQWQECSVAKASQWMKELLMYARNVTLHLKANKAAEFTRTLEIDVLPMLRKQAGFKDEITFLPTEGNEVLAISLWEKKENAEAYGRDTYAAVLRTLAPVVEGTRSEERRVGKECRSR